MPTPIFDPPNYRIWGSGVRNLFGCAESAGILLRFGSPLHCHAERKFLHGICMARHVRTLRPHKRHSAQDGYRSSPRNRHTKGRDLRIPARDPKGSVRAAHTARSTAAGHALTTPRVCYGNGMMGPLLSGVMRSMPCVTTRLTRQALLMPLARHKEESRGIQHRLIIRQAAGMLSMAMWAGASRTRSRERCGYCAVRP